MSYNAELINRLVTAYNKGDASAFAALFATNAAAFEYPGWITQSGREEIERFYAERFSTVSPRTKVLARIDLGGRIIDHERVELGDGLVFECAAIYEIDAGQITRIEIVRASNG